MPFLLEKEAMRHSISDPAKSPYKPRLTRMSLLTSGLVVAVLATAGLAGGAPTGDGAGIPVKVLEERRQALFDLLDPGIAVIGAAERWGFDLYPQASDFRQDNGFYYLTGIETPDAWLVMMKGEDGSGRTLVYAPERDPAAEMWTGRQLGMDEVKERSGAAVRPLSEFEAEIASRALGPGMTNTYPRVYLSFGNSRGQTRELVELAMKAGRSLSDVDPLLAQLRLVKDSVELARLRRAIDITAEAQREAMKAARPGMYEYELEAVVEYFFQSRGAERVGFPTIVGSGPNSVVLHHDKNRRRMEDGDLVVIDAGAEYGYYTADVTRTFPVNGKFTSRQRKIYELVLATQKTVIDSVRPGTTVWELERIARRYMRDHSKGLCSGGCDRYFAHGLSHWLGMDVHDVGDPMATLKPGMVLTIEPGIYLADEGLGVRIEDDVLVTESGHEVLSSEAPKTVEEIETLMKKSPRISSGGA
jgi:Xaa-Pro aminopeptidase